MHLNDTDSPPQFTRLGLTVSLIAALGALALSVYLAFVSLALGVAPAGCGGESGCGQVLASRWSQWFGLPVSLPAAGLYLAMIALLVLTQRDSQTVRYAAWRGLAGGALVIVGAAGWFVALQIQVVQATCFYCMLAHGLGLVLAGCVAFYVLQKPTAWRQAHLRWPMLAGVVLLAILMAGQLLNPTPAATRGQHSMSSQDTDQHGTTARMLTLLDGQLQINATRQPHLGPMDAEHVLVMMFDYCCPHCREAHELIGKLQAESDTPVLVVSLPTPLGQGCNPHVRRIPAFFEVGCTLARLSYAVWQVDPQQWPAYDRWLFDTPPKQPRKAEAARQHAGELIGEDALQKALASGWPDAQVQRNVSAYGEAHGGRLPLILSPGRRPIIGAVYDVGDLQRLLEEPPAAATSE